MTDKQILLGGPYDGHEFALPLGDLCSDPESLTLPIGEDGELVTYRCNGDRDERGRLIFRIRPHLA